MVKGSSSKTATSSKLPAPRAPTLDPSESGDSADEAKSEQGSQDEDDEDDTSSADSDELENVSSRRQNNGESSRGAGPSRPTGSSRQLPRYAPPLGMMPLSLPADFASSPFEWDMMSKKAGVELWAIRAPADLKTSRLASLNINMSSSGPSGSLKLKSSSYTLRSAGNPSTAKADVDEEGRQPTAGPGLADAMTMEDEGGERLKFEGGAEMMGGMRLMVPRLKEKGKLFAAPLEISRHLILVPDTSLSTEASHDNPLPSLLATSALDDALEIAEAEHEISQASSKRKQPSHLLKFRNFAIGSRTSGPDVKPSEHVPESAITAPDNHVNEMAIEESTPKKKRKSEKGGDTPGTKKKKVKV